ncbi:metalloprotease PmbA [Betaproteobacteria bacterium SCN2]|jgi:PmbA protein|nr:metalloprotease PmbA [Betaproteobacteria bacterium SCN2]
MSNSHFSYTQDKFRKIARQVLDHARAAGATAADTEVSEGFGQTVTVRKGEIETVEYNKDKGVGVTVYVGQRRGHASTSDLSDAALKATVEKAATIAKHTAEDEAAGLPEREWLSAEQPELDLFHPWSLTVEEAAELARACESAAFKVDRRIDNSEGASVSTQASHFIYANSLGFTGGYASTRQGVSAAVIASEAGAMQRDYWYTTARDAADMKSPEHVGRIAGERAVRRLNGRRLTTRNCPVVFEAPIASGLISSFVGAVSGGSLYRKSSFLLDSLGQEIFSPIVSLREDPFLKKGLGSCPFDNEGVRVSARDVVRNGVVQGYFLSSYSARKLGMQSTGNAGGSHNLILPCSEPGGELDLPAMLKKMGAGLLVTELLGHGTNMVTGDYSRGAAGFWVENGEIQYPVEEITIAGNLKDIFRDIQAIGSDVEVRGSKLTGSILVGNMMVAGE